jgi:hypothetical protein
MISQLKRLDGGSSIRPMMVIEADSQNFAQEKGGHMTAMNLTVKLTNEQQKQIRNATGKDIAELNIDLAATGHLTAKDLEGVAGGARAKNPDISILKPVDKTTP